MRELTQADRERARRQRREELERLERRAQSERLRYEVTRSNNQSLGFNVTCCPMGDMEVWKPEG